MNDDLERVFTVGNRSTDIDKIVRGEGYGPNWFACADGTVLSVIAGGGTYCTPRNDVGPFSTVEVWWPEDPEPTGYVEVNRVRDYIDAHGGVVAVATDEQTARASAPAPAPPITDSSKDRCSCGHHRAHHVNVCKAIRPVGIGSTPPGFQQRTERCPCLGFQIWQPAEKDAGRIEAGALVATFLLCLIGISLFFLAVLGSRAGLCKVDASHSYCEQVAK